MTKVRSVSLSDARIVVLRSEGGMISMVARHRRLEFRQRRLDLIDRVDDVGASDETRSRESPLACATPRRCANRRRSRLSRPDRRDARVAVAVGDDERQIVRGVARLIVGVDLIGASRCSRHRPLGCLRWRPPARRERPRARRHIYKAPSDLAPPARPEAPVDRHLPYAGQLRKPLLRARCSRCHRADRVSACRTSAPGSGSARRLD